MKATHYGHCQACGRRQLLPGGLLAAHGFDIQFGFQRGVCFGSGHLPYEQSCDLIERTIAAAVEEAGKLRARSIEISAVRDSRKTWRHLYRRDLSSRTRGSVHIWTEGEIEGTGFDAVFVWKLQGAEQRERLHCGMRNGDVLAHEGRQQYAAALVSYAEAQERYAEQQRRRISEWKPVELVARAGD